MKEYAYYPGCSIKGTGKGYEESLIALFNKVGISLKEMEDWNCCGATNYMNINEATAFTLSARNLALVKKSGLDVAVPCNACYLNLKKAADYIEQYPEIGRKVRKALSAAGLTYTEAPGIKHPLIILLDEIGKDELKKHVIKPLNGIRVIPYYGCQIVRPYANGYDVRYPMFFDEFLACLGAEVIDYAHKTRCCGGSLTGTIEDIGLRLNYVLLEEARKQNADCMVTLCPLCHFNLECYQDKINKRFQRNFSIPILYFSQIAGIAMGLPERKLGLQRSFIKTKKLLSVV